MMVRKGSKKKNPAIQLPDNFFAVLFMLAAFLCLFLRIRYIGLIGIQGVGYYSAACSWFLVLFAVIGAGMYSSVYHMTVSRMERMNEKGVIKTVRAALGCVFLCTFAFGGVAYLLAEVFSTKIMKLPLMAMTYRAFLPSLFFISAVLIFAGALDGIGEKQTSKKIGFLFCFLLFLFAPIITEPLYTYGEKVGALLQNEMYGPAYGAMGAALSFLAVSVLMFLLSGIFWLKARPSGREVGYGLAAGKEHDRFMGSVLSNALPVLLPALIWTAAMLGELILFFRTAKTEPGRPY